MSAARLAPTIPFPAVAYVPHRHPHPSKHESAVLDAVPDVTHRYALDLFNHGYYWEAHESWEKLWRHHGPNSLEGRAFHGLIALAAAGVKAREGNSRGTGHHARRAAAIFRGLGDERPIVLGLSITVLVVFAEAIAADPPSRPAANEAPPEVVFAKPLTPA